MRLHALDETEVEVFHFWVNRLATEYREPIICPVAFEKVVKNDTRLLRGQYYGKNTDEFWIPRPKL